MPYDQTEQALFPRADHKLHSDTSVQPGLANRRTQYEVPESSGSGSVKTVFVRRYHRCQQAQVMTLIVVGASRGVQRKSPSLFHQRVKLPSDRAWIVKIADML